MPKRSSKSRLSGETKDSVKAAPAPEKPVPAVEKNPAAVALGRLGGLKGGKARAAKLSKKRRSEIARKAALARWRKR